MLYIKLQFIYFIYNTMKHVMLFETFIDFKNNVDTKSKETSSNTITLYKDDNLTVKVVKTFDSCLELGKDTNWCSNQKSSFYSHNLTANMYRFIFKDGSKLRLTWDYIEGKTHWGLGGIVNGENLPYFWIRPIDNDEPFYIDYTKDDEKSKLLISRINSIPDNVIKIVTDYQNEKSIEKSKGIISMHKEISKIKIEDIVFIEEDDRTYEYKLEIKYLDKMYILKLIIQPGYPIGTYDWSIRYSKEFKKSFKNKYAFNDGTLDKYVEDKIKEFSKKHNNIINIKESISEFYIESIEELESVITGEYTIKTDKSGRYIDIDGDVNLKGMAFTKIPWKFGEVTGDFICDTYTLTTLENSPHYVGGIFDCSSNQLTNLVGLPTYIGEELFCYENNISSFEGFNVSNYPDYDFGDNPIMEVYRLVFANSHGMTYETQVKRKRKFINSIIEFSVIRGNKILGKRLNEALLDIDVVLDVTKLKFNYYELVE